MTDINHEDQQPQPLIRLDTYSSMMDANASIMEDIVNDEKMAPAEKLKSFSVGIRNQAILNRDLAARRKELITLGMKPNSDIQTLTFNPEA